MNDNYGPSWGQPVPPQRTKRAKAQDNFATAAVVSAVFAVISILFVILPIFFGPLAIIFAHLSRGQEKQLQKGPKIAKAVGLIMLIISLGITSATMIFITTQFDSPEQFMQEYITMMEDMGMDANDMERALEQYGIDPEEFGIEMQQYDSYDTPGSTAPDAATPDTLAPDTQPSDGPVTSHDEWKITVPAEPGTAL